VKVALADQGCQGFATRNILSITQDLTLPYSSVTAKIVDHEAPFNAYRCDRCHAVAGSVDRERSDWK